LVIRPVDADEPEFLDDLVDDHDDRLICVVERNVRGAVVTTRVFRRRFGDLFVLLTGDRGGLNGRKLVEQSGETRSYR
jgi:hypothetical protein